MDAAAADGDLSDPSPSNASYLTNDPEAQSFAGRSGSAALPEERANAYETRFGWRVDVMAGLSYVLGPLSGVLVRPTTPR